MNVAGAQQNLSAAPGFDPAQPYHLAAGSQCIDAGTATGAPDHDRDNDHRPQPTNGKYDIGADEFR